MKNILHFKFDISNRDINPEVVGKLLRLIQDRVGDDFLVIGSPFEPSILMVDDSDPNFKSLDIDKISVDELKRLIEGKPHANN